MSIPIKIAPRLASQDTSGVERNEQFIIYIIVAICVGLYFLGLYFFNKKLNDPIIIKILSATISIIIFSALFSIFIL